MLTALALASMLIVPNIQDNTLPKLVIDETKVGEGEAAKELDYVEVHYTGTLLDGKEFDSSLTKGVPLQFQLSSESVIQGWDQGILGMKAGGIRHLTVPSHLGYGDQGSGDVIPPKATLKFKVNLLRILPRTKIETLVKGDGEGFKSGQLLQCKVVMKAKDGRDLVDPEKPMTLEISRRSLPGLNQGIIGIKVGEKRKITMHAELAFGKRGLPPADSGDVKAGSLFSPGANVVAEIEALKITEKK